MTKKRLKILSKFKTPLPLMGALGIKILLPYENGEILTKNVVDVIDAANGVIEFGLSEFELDGLKVGPDQNFLAEIMFQNEKMTVLFAKGMNIVQAGERKAWK